MAFNVSALANYTEENAALLVTSSVLGAKTASLIKSAGNVMVGVKSSETINIMDTDAIFQSGGSCGFTASGSTTADTLRFFKASLKVKNKQLKYSDDTSSGLLPTNYAPVLCFGYCFMDGSLPDTASTNLQVYYESILKYEDI